MKKRINSVDKINPYSKNSVILILLRYVILLIVVFILLLPISSPLIYTIIAPLTIYPVLFLLKLFVDISYSAPFITLGGKTLIEIVPACIAGAAYILILILNLSVPMKLKDRVYSIIFSVLILLVFNIIRIVGFSLLYNSLFPYVDLAHKFFWYFISTIFIVAIWFFIVKIYKIREIPFYSDIRFIMKEIKKAD